MSTFSWDEERVAKLKQRWTDGASCREIAIELGCGKNAVVGKAHRLDLPRRRLGTNVPPHLLAARLNARRAALASAAASALGVALLDLEQDMCRWPVGHDSEHRFCGCQKQDAMGPYCAAHAAIAFVPLPAKVRKLERLRTPQHSIYGFGLDRFDREAA